jgi:hypothetical protein
MRDSRSLNFWHIVARVLFSYLRLPQFWFWSPVVVSVAAFISSSWPLRLILEGAPPDKELLHGQLETSVVLLSVTCVHFATFITGHTARLLALPHNHVVPGVRGPVLGVAIVMTLLGIVLPVVFWSRPELVASARFFPLWAGAVAAVIAAEFAWVQVWPSLMHLGVLPSLIATLPWLALTQPAGRRAFVEMYYGRNPGLAAALYTCAAILLVILWLLLFHRRQLAAMRPLLSWTTRERFARSSGGRGGVVWSHEHAVAGTPWRRFRLRSYLIAAGVRDGIAGAIGGAVIALAALALQLVFGPADVGTSLILSLVISILVPFILIMRAVEARKALLTFELLLPQSRPQFVRGFGLAMVANAYSAWTAAQLGMLAIYALFAPADLRASAHAFALVLPISAAYQLFFFGMSAWHLSLRPTMLNVATFFTVALIVIPVMAHAVDRPGLTRPTTVTLTGLGLVVGGVVLAYTAMRRWTHCEIT